jgi:predicted ATPase
MVAQLNRLPVETQQALMPEEVRAITHLRIGRLLATRIAPEEQEETKFEIVNQLDRGARLITSQDEREQVAKLNLIAGKRAKASSAYASARQARRRLRNISIRGLTPGSLDPGWRSRARRKTAILRKC